MVQIFFMINLVLKLFRVGGASDEPEELLGDAAVEGLLCRQQRECVVPQGEP